MKRSYEDLIQLPHNQNKKQFTELGLKGLVQIWVTFPRPTILVSYNNAIRPLLEDVKMAIQMTNNLAKLSVLCDFGIMCCLSIWTHIGAKGETKV